MTAALSRASAPRNGKTARRRFIKRFDSAFLVVRRLFDASCYNFALQRPVYIAFPMGLVHNLHPEVDLFDVGIPFVIREAFPDKMIVVVLPSGSDLCIFCLDSVNNEQFSHLVSFQSLRMTLCVHIFGEGNHKLLHPNYTLPKALNAGRKPVRRSTEKNPAYR